MQTKVLTSELKVGMFVSSLDRPWIDTPFMFQGFLIENEKDIELLKEYCEFVHIDWIRSPLPQPPSISSQQKSLGTNTGTYKRFLNNIDQPSVAISNTSQAVKNSNPSFTINSSDTSAAMASPNSISQASEAQKTVDPNKSSPTDYSAQEGLLSKLAGKMAGLFKGNPKSLNTSSSINHPSPTPEESISTYERPTFIPSNIELSMYADVGPVEQEITPALKAHHRASNVLNSLVQDVKSNKRFSVVDTEAVIQDVISSMVRNPDAMMWVTRLRKQDELVYGHGLQVAVYLVALGRHLGLPKDFLGHLCMIGLLLDIGKIKLQPELLLKKGRLDTAEFETMKSHVQLALDILKDTPNLHPDVLEGIAQHHERENGTGYPAGLSGSEISLYGRMAAIVDSFSALTSQRSYAEAMPAYEALHTLSNFNTELYQATMIEQFIQAIGVFPVGSMVELSSGEVAVVISHSKIRRLKPRVLIISDSNKIPLPQPTTLDLLSQPKVFDQKELYISRGLPLGAFGLDAREFYLT
jgi:HD-GYP domain-containing protein (c-di-GMP phosphodiesterase class II)